MLHLWIYFQIFETKKTWKMQFFSQFQSIFSILKYTLKTSYYEIKQFASIWKYYLSLKNWVFTFPFVSSKYFCPVRKSFKKSITLVKRWIYFYFLSQTSLHRNMKYKPCAIKYTTNLSEWSVNFGNGTKMFSGPQEKFFYCFPR